MRFPVRLALGLAPFWLAASAPAARTPDRIVADAPASAWAPVPAEDLMVMQLASGQRIVIQLAPEFAPAHVANIRRLARAGWWDGASIVRVQDNYVVQWARMPEHQPLPEGVLAKLPAEYERAAAGITVRPLGSADAYALQAGFGDDWPVGTDGQHVWLAHCFGMVGVARDMPPDTGDGTELYAVNGQAPRQLDRNLALVGRVLDGMPGLGALPRGTAALSFYADPAQRIPIRSVRIAADLPASAQPHFDVMRTGSASFAAYLDARAHRRDRFFVRPSAGVDLCNVPVPVRAR